MEPEAAVVAAAGRHPDGRFRFGGGRGEDDRFHRTEFLHVDRQRLRRGAVGLAAPKGVGVVIDRHQRAAVDGGVRCLRAGRQLAGGDGAAEDAAVLALLLDVELHLVAAGGGELDADLVGIGAEVAVAVLDLNVNEVAGLDLVLRPAGGAGFGGFGLGDFLFQGVGEGCFLLVDDLTAGDFELAVGGDLQPGVGWQFEAELLFEVLRIVDGDGVATGDLKRAVAGLRDAEDAGDFGEEDALAGAAAGEEGLFHIVTGFGPDHHRDAGVAVADAEVGILDHHRDRGARGVPELELLAEAANGPQGFELGEEALLDAVDLGEVEEGLVGKVGIRRILEHGEEDAARLVVLILAQGDHA